MTKEEIMDEIAAINRIYMESKDQEELLHALIQMRIYLFKERTYREADVEEPKPMGFLGGSGGMAI